MTAMQASEAIIVFDGTCRLCLASLRFVNRHDKQQRLRYVPFQTAAGRMVCEHLGLDRDALESFLLLEGGQAHRKAAAWSRILLQLSLPWSWAGHLIGIMPAALGDRVYDFVGRHRVRWFGRNDSCTWPPPVDPRSASMDEVRQALSALAPTPH